MRRGPGSWLVVAGLLSAALLVLSGCGNTGPKSEADRLKALQRWAADNLRPRFRASTHYYFMLFRSAYKANWPLLDEYLDSTKHTISVQRDSSNSTYHIIMKITNPLPTAIYRDYDWMLFTDTLVEGVEYIYGGRGRPPETISAFRVEMYSIEWRAIKPESAYEPGVYESFEQLEYAATFPRAEALKVSDWDRYIKYCDEHRGFIFSVCIDRYTRLPR